MRRPPLVQVHPGLEDRGRAGSQAPAQLRQARVGRLPYPEYQRPAVLLVPYERVLDQGIYYVVGHRPARRVTAYADVVATVVPAASLVSDIKQCTEHALQCRPGLVGRLLSGQPLAREHPDQVMETILAPGPGSAAGAVDQPDADQFVDEIFRVPDRHVQHRGRDPRREDGRLQQREQTEQPPGRLAGTLVDERDGRPDSHLTVPELIEAVALIGQPFDHVLHGPVRSRRQPRPGYAQRKRQVVAMLGDRG